MKVKKIIVWFLTVFLALGALVFMPSVASLFGLVAVALIFPLEKYQRWLGCYLKKWMIITGASVLAFLMLITAPTTESEQSEPPKVQQGQEQEKTPQSEEPSKEEPSENEAPKEEKPAEDPAETPEEEGAAVAPSEPPAAQEPPATAPQEPTKPSHQHSFKAATCTAPKTCSCGATEGSKLGHNWSAATCTTAKKCSVCGATDGSAKGHSWSAATCKTPKTCSICGVTSGSKSGHNYSNGKCTFCGAINETATEEMVWIPTKGGKKYHSYSGCSNMDDPQKVTLSKAKAQGYEACKRCH